jgi:glycosyltransferase involved in cell wall biosynthesis
LPDAIESVLSQTFKNFEIIVVNDGSTDNTVDVLQPYMGMIKYIYKENGGLSSARNVGIQNSTGEYLAFLDTDDMSMPDKLRIQSAILDENPDVGMVYSNEYIVYGDDKDKIYPDCRL